MDAFESGAFEDASGSVSNRKCVKLDSCSHYVNEKVTIGTKNVTYAHCLSSCPEPLPVRGTDSKQRQICSEVNDNKRILDWLRRLMCSNLYFRQV